MNEITLAEALLRRKELQGKVDVLKTLQGKALFEVKARRIKVTDAIDDVVAEVPRLTASQVTEEFDFYARQLRKVDAVIQRTNWETAVQLEPSCLEDYKPQK